MKKKERVHYEHPKTWQLQCKCVENKKKSIKLCSNLYEINMMYLPKQKNEPKKKFMYNPQIDSSRNELYTSSKGINMEIETQVNHNTTQPCLNFEKKDKKNTILNTSIHSCTILQRCHKDS